jgi:hypothetical protein
MVLEYQRAARYRPVLSSVATDDLRDLLSRVQIQNYNFSGVAISAVNLQLKNWQDSETTATRSKSDLAQGLTNAFGIDFAKVNLKGTLGENPTEDVDAIIAASGDRHSLNSWDYEGLPYTIRCVGLARAQVSSPPRKKKKTDQPAFSNMDTDGW